MLRKVVATKLTDSNLTERLGFIISSTGRDGYRRSMVETLRYSRAAIWYMDKANEDLLEASKKIGEQFVNGVENNRTKRYHDLRRPAIAEFRT